MFRGTIKGRIQMFLSNYNTNKNLSTVEKFKIQY